MSVLQFLETSFFVITSRILRILIKHIDLICSLESRLFFGSICSIGIFSILEVIAKTIFSKIAKCSTLDKTSNHVTKLILDQEECDASIEDHDGSTAMSIAMDCNHRDIGVMLYAKMNF